MTYNQIAYQTMLETQRSNRAREAETGRANLANEALKGRELTEAERSNVARETETNRHNIATEGEAARHNRVSEATSQYVADTGRYSAVSNRDLGLRNIGLGYSQLAETNRSNLEQESIGRTRNVFSVLNANTAAEASKYAADTNAKSRDLATAVGAATALMRERQQNNRLLLTYPVDTFSKLTSSFKSGVDAITNLRRR